MLDRLGVRAIALHLGLYDRTGHSAWFALQALGDHGWYVQRSAGPVLLFERRSSGSVPSLLRAPNPTVPVYCQGWYADTGNGRYMSETHAPLWVFGDGHIRLRFAPAPLSPRVTVHGGTGSGWHLVTVDVPHLMRVPGQKKRVGARLLDVREARESP